MVLGLEADVGGDFLWLFAFLGDGDGEFGGAEGRCHGGLGKRVVFGVVFLSGIAVATGGVTTLVWSFLWCGVMWEVM